MTKISTDYFEKKHNLPKGSFHKKIKPKIKKYATKHGKLHQVGDNPDIALDKNNNIHLISTYPSLKGRTVNLQVKIDYFL